MRSNQIWLAEVETWSADIETQMRSNQIWLAEVETYLP